MPRLSLLVLLFFSVYVSLSKNSFWEFSGHFLKAGAKVPAFFVTTKTFPRKSSKNHPLKLKS